MFAIFKNYIGILLKYAHTVQVYCIHFYRKNNSFEKYFKYNEKINVIFKKKRRKNNTVITLKFESITY